VGPGICTSDKYPSDAEAAGPGAILGSMPDYAVPKPFEFQYFVKDSLYLSTPNKRQTKN
jgi:hypothetical protein